LVGGSWTNVRSGDAPEGVFKKRGPKNWGPVLEKKGLRKRRKQRRKRVDKGGDEDASVNKRAP